MAIPIDDQGWLLPGQYGGVTVVTHPQTQKTSPFDASLNNKPIGIVWHWTGGGYGKGGGRAPTDYTISDSYSPATHSWHFYVNKAGEIHQFAPIFVGTWTTGAGGKLFDRLAGVPIWRTFPNVNRATLGVEMENAGVLLPHDGKWYAWPYASNAATMSEVDARNAAAAGHISFESQYAVDPSRVIQWQDGNAYDRWTDLQVLAAQEMARAVAAKLAWTDPERIHYGHRTFYTKRDPGLAWMDGVLPNIERSIFGRAAGGAGSSPNTPLFLLALLGAGLVAWKYRRS